MWESVVHANAAERRGTHATKNRALVSGSGKKPWRQKGTGRARVGSSSRTPLWRHGGTVFGPQPRSYDFKLSKKVERGALRAALATEGQGRRAGGRRHAGGERGQDQGGRGTAEATRLRGQGGARGRRARRKAVAVGPQYSRACRSCRARGSPRATVIDARARGGDAGRFGKTTGGARLKASRSMERDGFSRATPMKLTDVIRRPLITEKTSILREDGRTIVFQVATGANKVRDQARRRTASRLEGREHPDEHRAREDQAPGAISPAAARTGRRPT